MTSKKIKIALSLVILFLVGGIGMKAIFSDSVEPPVESIVKESNEEKIESTVAKKDSKQEEKKSEKEQKNDEQASKESSTPAKEKESTNETNIEESSSKDGIVEIDQQQVAQEPKANGERKEASPSTEKQVEKKEGPKQSAQPESVVEEKQSVVPETSPPLNTKPETPSQPVEVPPPTPEAPIATVLLSITTGDVKGTILADTNVEYQEGDTALDITLRMLQEKGIQYDVTGSGGGAYVRGFDNLYEFDEGPLSGWHIRVNGEMIDRSAGIYPVKIGDSINWNYTTNYMEDSEDW